MKEGATNGIELDKGKIDQAIASSEKFDEPGIFIKKWQGGATELDNKDKYLTEISKNNSKYIGTLDPKFKREGYGLQIFENGDKYLGQFSKDQRNEDGAYFWAPEPKDSDIHSELYLGNWKNNKKDNNCIYLWIDQPENNTEYEKANFDAYIGELENDKYKRGTYTSKTGDNLSLYHGNFDSDGKKTDENAFFYTSQTNRIFLGKINKEILISGYLGTIDENGKEIKEFAFCTFNEDGSVKEIVEMSKLNPDEADEAKRKIGLFNDVILKGNYLKKIYNKYVKIKNKVDKEYEDRNAFDKKENIAVVKKLINKYKRKNIFIYIEEFFFGKEF